MEIWSEVNSNFIKMNQISSKRVEMISYCSNVSDPDLFHFWKYIFYQNLYIENLNSSDISYLYLTDKQLDRDINSKTGSRTRTELQCKVFSAVDCVPS